MAKKKKKAVKAKKAKKPLRKASRAKAKKAAKRPSSKKKSAKTKKPAKRVRKILPPPAEELMANGEPLFTIDQGQGPPVVLVHGFPLDHSMWRHQIEALRGRYRVIAPDLRGFGLSEWLIDKCNQLLGCCF